MMAGWFAVAFWHGLLVCLTSLVSLVNCYTINPMQQDQIRRMANEVLNCGDIPGMSLAVVDGKATWTLPMGVANLKTGEAISESTQFAIGSLTKAFTATLLLTLLGESRQRYTVDTRLKDILHQGHLFPDDLRSEEATPRDLLSHRMGLARADLALFAGYPDSYSLENMSRSLHCLPVQTSFRNKYLYSNFMYNLAGHVIEKLSNQSFASALETRILQPLGMTSTKTRYNVTDSKGDVAQPYLTVQDKLVPSHPSLFDLKQFLPSLGLVSNARDMITWLKAQLGPYRRSSRKAIKVIADDVIALTHQPVMTHINNLLRPRFPVSDLTFAYGMGWNQAVYRGFRRIWHTGTLYGFTSIVWLYPDLDIGIFITVNGPARVPDTRDRINAFLYYITDVLMGDIPWLSQSSICTYPRPVGNGAPPNYQMTSGVEQDKGSSDVLDYCAQNNISITTSEFSLEKFAGTFHNRLFGQAYVYVNGSLKDEFVKSSGGCRIGLGILFGERFEGVLLPTQSRDRFQMKPTGNFEFSAHTAENKLSTMPVIFSNFDYNGIPNSLKAVWQKEEIIEFRRDSKGDECFSHMSTNGSSLARTFITLQTLILLEFLLNSSVVFLYILQDT